MRDTRSTEQARKRQRRSRAQWLVEVRRWRRSGKTVADYAEAHDLATSTLTWWARELRGAIEADSATKPERKPAFLAVQVREAAETPKPPSDFIGLEVVLANGRVVRVVGDFDVERVSRLIAAAEGASRC
jgi:hypothetical protein